VVVEYIDAVLGKGKEYFGLKVCIDDSFLWFRLLFDSILFFCFPSWVNWFPKMLNVLRSGPSEVGQMI
jgi:hypothetical protein